MKDAIFPLSASLLLGCTCICGGTTPKPNVDASDEKTACKAACDNMTTLHCPEGDPVSTGNVCYLPQDCESGQQCAVEPGTDNMSCHVTCEDWCSNTVSGGVPFPTSCLTAAKTCDAVAECGT